MKLSLAIISIKHALQFTSQDIQYMGYILSKNDNLTEVDIFNR